MQSSSNEWAQDMFMPELGFDDDDDDEPAINTGEAASGQVVVIAGDKSRGPKVLPKLGSVGKPIRRRSRASRKSPATLLNANASNFRALVQQFTGCHSPLSPFGMTTTTNYKGPINLNFAQHKSCNLGRRWSINHAASADADEQVVDQQRFFSFTTNNINNIDAVTTTTTTTSGELLHHVSTVDNYELPTPDHHPLTLDDFDLENLSLQQLMSGGPADYPALPAPGTRNDPVFWGYN
ncbi:hypothetical protein ABFS83_13G190800 [Erythranthe nasuta]